MPAPVHADSHSPNPPIIPDIRGPGWPARFGVSALVLGSTRGVVVRPGGADPLALRRQGPPGRRAAHRRQPDARLGSDWRRLAPASPPRRLPSRAVGLLLPDRRLRGGPVGGLLCGHDLSPHPDAGGARALPAGGARRRPDVRAQPQRAVPPVDPDDRAAADGADRPGRLARHRGLPHGRCPRHSARRPRPGGRVHDTVRSLAVRGRAPAARRPLGARPGAVRPRVDRARLPAGGLPGCGGAGVCRC